MLDGVRGTNKAIHIELSFVRTTQGIGRECERAEIEHAIVETTVVEAIPVHGDPRCHTDLRCASRRRRRRTAASIGWGRQPREPLGLDLLGPV